MTKKIVVRMTASVRVVVAPGDVVSHPLISVTTTETVDATGDAVKNAVHAFVKRIGAVGPVVVKMA